MSGSTLEVRLEPYEIVTIAATIEVAAGRGDRSRRARPERRAGAAGLRRLLAAQQGCRADGLPIGHGPDQAVVHQRRRSVRGAGRRRIGAHRRSHRPDPWSSSCRPAGRRRPRSGSTASPPARTSPSTRRCGRPADASPGRYFVAARIVDEGGQTHEDVVTVDLPPGRRWNGPEPGRRRALGRPRLGRRTGADDGRGRSRARRLRSGRGAA